MNEKTEIIQEHKEDTKAKGKVYSVNKLMRGANIAFFLFFVLFGISKSIFQQLENGWSDPPVIDFFLIFGFSASLSILFIVQACYAWIYNAEEFRIWNTRQDIWKRNSPHWISYRIQKVRGFEFPVAHLWVTRLITPLFSLIGIVGIGISIVAIINFFRYF